MVPVARLPRLYVWLMDEVDPVTTTVTGSLIVGPLYLIRIATAPPVQAWAAGAIQAVLVTSNSQMAHATGWVSVQSEPVLVQASPPRAHVPARVPVSVPCTTLH